MRATSWSPKFGATGPSPVSSTNAIAADPLLDLAKTESYSMRGDETKRNALFDGYGALPEDWPERLAVYQLYHALELWDWFASIGNKSPLEGIAGDMRRLVR
jgi:hygromycin-B 7''-O-kinase